LDSNPRRLHLHSCLLWKDWLSAFARILGAKVVLQNGSLAPEHADWSSAGELDDFTGAMKPVLSKSVA